MWKGNKSYVTYGVVFYVFPGTKFYINVHWRYVQGLPFWRKKKKILSIINKVEQFPDQSTLHNSTSNIFCAFFVYCALLIIQMIILNRFLIIIYELKHHFSSLLKPSIWNDFLEVFFTYFTVTFFVHLSKMCILLLKCTFQSM